MRRNRSEKARRRSGGIQKDGVTREVYGEVVI